MPLRINRGCYKLMLLVMSGATIVFCVFFLVVINVNAADADLEQIKKEYRRPPKILQPQENPASAAKVNLGKILFFDPRLSGLNAISCASCHNPGLAWGDGLAKGMGHGHVPLARRTPTILNVAWLDRLFWDGRATSLEEQALAPIGADAEMHMALNNLPKKIEAIPGYKKLFAAAFPNKNISNELIAMALASFERTLVSGPAPFDHWIAGHENAISKEAKLGFLLFQGKANCAKCHAGWSFTDGSFHDIGMPDGDIGRGKFLPKLPSMQHAFKTPTLRDIARRAPYMHDGSAKTLEDVIDFYIRGGVARRDGKSEDIFPLKVSAEEKHALVEFLKTLTSDPKPVTAPNLPN